MSLAIPWGSSWLEGSMGESSALSGAVTNRSCERENASSGMETNQWGMLLGLT